MKIKIYNFAGIKYGLLQVEGKTGGFIIKGRTNYDVICQALERVAEFKRTQGNLLAI